MFALYYLRYSSFETSRNGVNDVLRTVENDLRCCLSAINCLESIDT